MIFQSLIRSVIVIVFVVLLCFIDSSESHGFMLFPCQRGTLPGNNFVKVPPCDKTAPIDYRPHFPAGDKRPTGGAGKKYQMMLGKYKYETFEPLKPGFRWRAGVCGDKISGKDANEHVKGGKYYHGGKIVATFKKGSILKMKLAIIAHHKGYIEAHVCNVNKKFCKSGDLTPSCFTKKNCVQLERAPNKVCDSGYSTKCGPKDKNYPGRWYLPCDSNSKVDVYGENGEIAFKLPSEPCEHCVLHWAWITAMGCHAEGIGEYFNGPNRPKKWDVCPNGKRGGFADSKKPCGGPEFPEEYYQCADIAMTWWEGCFIIDFLCENMAGGLIMIQFNLGRGFVNMEKTAE